MKHFKFSRTGPAFAVVLALASTSAHGGTIRGGTTSADTKAAAQSTAAQSIQQAGSVETDSSAEVASRRARLGSFVTKAVGAIKKVVTPSARASTANLTENENRELSAHIVDAKKFMQQTRTEGRLFVSLGSGELQDQVKHVILDGPYNIVEKMAQSLVDELATTDEEALHALLLLANYRVVNYLKEDKPEVVASLNRIEERLKAAGLASVQSDGVTFTLAKGVAPAILAAPGARKLLHNLTDNETQQKAREALAKERATILNVSNAQASIEKMQALKKYITAMYREAGVEVFRSDEFFNMLRTFSHVSANGGVVLVFNDNPFPVGIYTAHGGIAFDGSTYLASQSDRADRLFGKYVRDLGLELISEPRHSNYREYAVTRLPDGTKIPKATRTYDTSVTATELRQLALKVPEKVRRGIKVHPK